MKANYRKGGLFALPFAAIAIVLAVIMGAPVGALISIGIFGFGA